MLNKKFISKLGLNLSDLQIQTLQNYAELVLQKNKEFNLTAAKTLQEIFDRHICDGLQLAALLKKEGLNKKIGADFGSGAGFIGLTVAIVLPEIKIHLVDSLQKRTKFLQWIIYKLCLKNVEVITIKIGQEELKNKFDFILERAMGEIDDILPLCLKNLNDSGSFWAMLSKNTQSQIKAKREHFYSLPGDKEILGRKISIYYGHR
ncbi:MAG: 16S rRNA (guanine(527)-N(7))-methyltransferase RsmG [Elusimicrobiaceae bacterium]|nr:16S rRNA (guanine(527)-N(7))-methyltransferase RsmG [Elusimicrobiaceae bacterium]